jgi:hypothetical protein
MTDIGFYHLTANSEVVFSLKDVERVVSGPEEALQIVAYHLFMGRGTNSYDRDEGGNLRKLITGNIKSLAEVRTDATIAVSRTLANIRRTQSDDKPADAKIIGLRLLDARIDREHSSIALTIRVDLLDGNSFQATFRVT